MKLTATPITAACAGAFTGLLMPQLWPRLSEDSTMLVIAFLLVVALPAHALVVGFGRQPEAKGRAVDAALLKRVSAWLLAAVAAAFLSQSISGHAAEPSKVRVLSIVLVAEPKLPDAKAFRSALEKRLPARFKIGDMEADGDKVILLRMHGGTVAVGLVDAPLPKGQIDDLCATAWYWRQACEATAAHRAHIVASVLDTDLDKLDAHLLLTDVVAALMDGNAIASYWNASLQPRDEVLRQSAEFGRERLPVMLWVRFRITNDLEKGFSLSTQGMEAFDLREIEAKDVNRPGREVLGLLTGMAQYLISKGPVIQDGETIGASPALDIRVRQGPSYWREGATVYRVTWPR